jgi:hypothetical protein
VTDPACVDWVEFPGIGEAYPILNVIGHLDRMYVTEPTPGTPPFEGFTLRMFEPESQAWRIWWSSTPRAPGVLDLPVEGGFTGRHGVFECDDNPRTAIGLTKPANPLTMRHKVPTVRGDCRIATLGWRGGEGV